MASHKSQPWDQYVQCVDNTTWWRVTLIATLVIVPSQPRPGGCPTRAQRWVSAHKSKNKDRRAQRAANQQRKILREEAAMKDGVEARCTALLDVMIMGLCNKLFCNWLGNKGLIFCVIVDPVPGNGCNTFVKDSSVLQQWDKAYLEALYSHRAGVHRCTMALTLLWRCRRIHVCCWSWHSEWRDQQYYKKGENLSKFWNEVSMGVQGVVVKIKPIIVHNSPVLFIF